MKIGTLFAKLAGKAGLNTSDPKYADLLAMASEIPDDDANKISGSLLTLDDAKQNHDLKKYFMSQALDGADQEINKLMDEMGFEVKDKEELKAVTSTYQRIAQLGRKIQSLESKKAGATGADKKELQDKINEATNKIVELEKSHKQDIDRINSEWQGKLTGSTIRSIIAGKKFANTNLPADVNVETSMILLNKELEKVGAKIVNQNGILQLKQSKDQDLDWLNSANEKPSVEQFLDGVLATNKLLAVNDAAGHTTNHSQNGNGIPPGNFNAPYINGGGGNAQNPELMAAINADRKALEDALQQ